MAPLAKSPRASDADFFDWQARSSSREIDAVEQRRARSSYLVSYAWQLQLWPVLAMNGILLVLVPTEIVLKRVYDRRTFSPKAAQRRVR